MSRWGACRHLMEVKQFFQKISGLSDIFWKNIQPWLPPCSSDRINPFNTEIISVQQKCLCCSPASWMTPGEDQVAFRWSLSTMSDHLQTLPPLPSINCCKTRPQWLKGHFSNKQTLQSSEAHMLKVTASTDNHALTGMI